MRCSVRRDQIVTGERSLIIKQTIITLPFYYYIKIVSEENLLWWKHFFKIWKDGQISFLNLIIPLIFPLFICYWIVYSDLNKTEYDLDTTEHLDKREAVPQMSRHFGFFYYIYGMLGAALIDFALFLLKFLPIFF